MRKIVVATENAIFEFERIDTPEPLLEDNNRLHIALDLIAAGKGSVSCKICNKTYKPYQLKPIIIGAGKSPFELTVSTKGGIKNRIRSKKQPALFGGKGCQCPEGHELISMITWRT